VRRAAPSLRVVRAGVRLGRDVALPGGLLLSVGLAGGLRPDAAPGTVVVPTEVALDDARYRCDERWSGALEAAAKRLGLAVLRAPLITTERMVTGAARKPLAAQGYAAVDTETGYLAARGAAVAAVRVLLDTPQRELSPRWLHPASALLDPRTWGDAIWLVRNAPRYARRAAEVLASALADLDVDPQV